VTAVLALLLALLALGVSGVCLWIWVGWHRDTIGLAQVANQLAAEARLDQLTAQTLSAMRDAARRAPGSSS
jgi:hypothetical protein